MNYYLLENFLSSYSLPTLLIAMGVAITCFLLERIFQKKLSIAIKTQLPFMLAIVLYFIYDMIFIAKEFVFNDTAFLAGVVCGSLAVIFRALINKLKRGDASVSSALSLLIEGVLDGVIKKSQLHGVAIAVEQMILDCEQQDQQELSKKINAIIKENAICDLSDCEINRLSALILQSTEGLN